MRLKKRASLLAQKSPSHMLVYSIPLYTCQHGICENIMRHAKMSQMLFLRIQWRLAWIGLWRQLLPPTSGCVYKMLVACASDNKGRSFIISWMLCASLLLQGTQIHILLTYFPHQANVTATSVQLHGFGKTLCNKIRGIIKNGFVYHNRVFWWPRS